MSETNPTVMRFQWRAHKVLWNASGGRLGRQIGGLPNLELVTTGRKSGEPRQILITYFDHEGSPTLVGTNAGRDSDPAWVLNLRADPNARARWNGTWRDVTARELTSPEQDQVWESAVAASPAYGDYAQSLTRPIPIMVLIED
jgi:deazaflavin-dependent oxidoreductase (nitroreductase family)